jgi:endonuclease/exonuclease/phosphatase family metal-dependent hydrolase
MTFNLHHGVGTDGGLDLERAAALVEASGADVVAVQEVDSGLGPRSAFVDQPLWLARRLMTDVAYGATIVLPATSPGDPPRRYGTALLSRRQLHDPRAEALPSTPRAEPRGYVTATVEVAGRRARVVATHLQHDSPAGRLAQARALAAEVAASPEPVVLLGDLNATPGAPELAPLTDPTGRGGAGLVDAWVVGGDGPGATFPSDAPRARIDHVLVAAELTVTAAAVVPTDASDHRPVVVDLLVPAFIGEV